MTGFRLASTERRFDRGIGGWRDGDTMFYAVSCWRGTAENVADSLAKGQPVIVHGRLKERDVRRQGRDRRVLEWRSTRVTVGHDLTRGVAASPRRTGPRRDEATELADLAGDGRPAPTTDAGPTMAPDAVAD